MADARFHENGDGDFEMARVVGAKSERGLGIVPVARTVPENLPQATVVRGTNAVPPPQQRTNNNRTESNNRQRDDDSDGNAGACACVIFLVIGVVVFVNTNSSDSSGGPTPEPTPFPVSGPTFNPTPPPTVAFNVCPATLVGGVRQDMFTCTETGCGGMISWCGLNDANSYEISVAIRGDYNSLSEFITIFIDGESIVGSGIDQCGSTFLTVAVRVDTPVGGVLSIGYLNSGSVDPICSGFTAMEMQVTLTEQ